MSVGSQVIFVFKCKILKYFYLEYREYDFNNACPKISIQFLGLIIKIRVSRVSGYTFFFLCGLIKQLINKKTGYKSLPKVIYQHISKVDKVRSDINQIEKDKAYFQSFNKNVLKIGILFSFYRPHNN